MELPLVVVLALLVLGVVYGTNEEGQKFLDINEKAAGVVTLKSGLQYKVLKKGEGKYHPADNSPCTLHFAGTTPALTPNAVDIPEADWNHFDSSYARGSPATFAPLALRGWEEAMQRMVEGDKWEMYFPSELGYGDQGAHGEKIKGGDVLIFRMEILKINGATKRAYKCDFKTKENCEADEVETIEAWGKKPLEELSAEVVKLKAKSSGTLKTDERKQVGQMLKALKQIEKARKKGMEL